MATCADCRFIDKQFPAAGFCHIRAKDHGWPEVAFTDWCGEHKPAKSDPAASLALMADALAPFLAVANAAIIQTGELLITTDLTDDEGEPLNLSSWDFVKLADAYTRATGA